ncbi:HTH_Tnp_Tc3_2 domain-containing protein [Trichonephila clavipes]|nr:HTH_Tnp_Tc3_2 domain-containing protein [Trichonephila clavipes]
MGHGIFEVAMKFGFSCTTISRVYREYRKSGKNIKSTTSLWPEKDHARTGTTLPQIAAYFNAGPSTSVTVRTIQRIIIDMGFRSRRPTRVPLLTARLKALRLTSARQHRYWIVEDWKHVARSSRFQFNRADGRVRLILERRRRYDFDQSRRVLLSSDLHSISVLMAQMETDPPDITNSCKERNRLSLEIKALDIVINRCTELVNFPDTDDNHEMKAILRASIDDT